MSTKKVEEAKGKKPQFVFVGDPNDGYSGRNVVTVKGVRFIRNRPTEVPEDRVEFFNKHNHFLTPDKADKLLKKLADMEAKVVDEEFDEDDHGGQTAPAPSRSSGDETANYDAMSMAQLHMAVAEAGKSAKGDATKEELIAILKGE